MATKRKRWPWVGVGVGAGLMVPVFTAGLLLPASDFVRAAVSDLTLSVVPVAAGVACILRSRRDAPARRGWFLLGLSCIAWGIGGGIWSYLELVRQEFPSPSIADAGYLASYPLAILAMLAFPAAPGRTVSRLRVLLDATVIVAALLFVSWAMVLSPLYQASTGSLLSDVIALTYPAGDVLLSAIVFLVLTRAAPAQRIPLALIAAGLLAQITSALAAARLPASSLVLELTENVLLHDSAALRARLGDLRALGVRLAIDDFGTGYSSLGYLRQFPFDILKIDKSFADGLGTEPSGSALLAAVTRMGDTLGLTTLVGGVERPDQVAELIALGCRFAQGYHFSHPLAPAELETWLTATHWAAPAPALGTMRS